jgi:hypothetical protein
MSWAAVMSVALAVVTAAVVGSMVHTLPPSCTVIAVNGISYQQCGSTWYQPQFDASLPKADVADVRFCRASKKMVVS